MSRLAQAAAAGGRQTELGARTRIESRVSDATGEVR